MILEKQKDALIMEIGDESDSLDMSLDLDSAQILMQMLSKNLYADAIGSTVRETCSNALDSHRRAKIDDPIVVSLTSNNDNTYSFSVEDFGIGLDANDVATIISKYGKSTKRNMANELGMMGLGFKSPLAYSSSFHFICRKDGMEWKYMMYEGEDSNKIDLLYSSKTSERNGVKIIIPVKNQDKVEFLRKIREQLAYFESVYFNTGNVQNDFQIIRTEHYQTSPLTSTGAMHICLDNIYYPIDFAKLGIASINVPLGLRFGLNDGIFPTPNRESIRYTQEAKTIILKKISTVAEIIVNMYNKGIVATSDIKVIFNYYGSSSRTVTIGETSYDVLPFLKHTNIALQVPTLIGVTLLDLKDLYNYRSKLLAEYSVKFHIKGKKISELKMKDYSDVEMNDLESGHCYLYDEPIGGRKKDYIRDEVSNYSKYYICRKTRAYTLGFVNRNSATSSAQKYSYYHLLKLKNFKKEHWRQVIKEFQFVQNIYTSKFIDIDNITVPQSWLDARKRDRVNVIGAGRRVKLTGEIFGKTAVALERYVNGQNCKFVTATYQLSDISKFKGLTVYDSYDNQSKLDQLYYITKGTSMNIRILSFSNREMKILSTLNIHNLISYDTFMKGESKPFRRLITAYLIQELIDKYPNTFAKKRNLETISKPLMNKLAMLEKYKCDNFRYADSTIYEAMLPVAKEHLYFDMEVYIDYLDIKDVLTKLTFLEVILKTVSYTNGEIMVPVLIDLFKYYKHRIDYQNYKVPLNETLDLDALLLTDETIEELINN